MSTFLKLRRVSFIVFLSLTYMLAKGQQSMSIGDSQVKNSAVLYLKGNGNQGLIIPITTSAPAATFGEAGMIVYSSNEKSVYFHNGTSWVDVGGGSSSGGGNYSLSLTGNDFILKDGSTVKSTVPLASAPVAGQFLMWDGAKWAATSVSQDIANAAGVITVNGLKGKALPALPATGGSQILIYDTSTSTWKFQAITSGGTVTSVATGTGLTGGPITTTGTLSVDVGTTANKIVQLDAAGKLPAVNGSALTSLPDPSSTNEIQNLSTAGTGTIAASESFDVAISSGTGIKIKEGTNIQIDQLANVLTINSIGGSGTVTSVALSLPTIFSVSGSPITTSGTLTATLSSQTANTFFAAPSASIGTPAFRTIVAADIPALDAAKITTGLLPVSVGGTGKNTWNGLLYGTGATLGDITNGTAGQYLKIAGTTPTWSTLSVVDADVNAAAAIAGTKINPVFGAQSILSGATNQFAIDNTGNITKINNVVTSFPASQGAANSVLTNNGSGTLTWNTLSSGFATNNVVPRGNGSGLVSSTIQDDGTTTGIGVGPSAANKLTVTNSTTGILQGIYVTNSQVGAGTSIGVKVDASGSTNTNFGTSSSATGGGLGATGVFGTATNSVTSQGVYGTVTGTGVTNAYGVRGAATSTTATNYGIYGEASGGATNWAGYFKGNTNIEGGLAVGSSPNFGTSGQVLTSTGPGTTPAWTTFSGSTLISNGGVNNIFAGSGAGIANTSGYTNAFFGVDAGKVNTTGAENTIIGALAGDANTTGSFNVFVGKFAGTSNVSSNLNTYVGYQSGHLATSAGNSFFGRLSGDATTTGGLNTFIGNMAGQTNVSGSNNTTLGISADVGSGALTNATAIGANAVVSASNALVLGNNASVGIGLSAPVSKLHINNATASNTFSQFTNSTSGTTATDGLQVGINSTAQAIINNQEATDLIVQSNSVPALWMDNSGRIGMRGTPDAAYNFLAYGVNPALGLDNTGIKIGDVLGNSFGNYFYTDFEATPKFAFMGANVGIGTLTPGNALHVTPNSTTFAIRIDQGVNGDGFLSYVNTTSAARTVFSAQSNTSGLVVLGNGAVGIGTGAPTSKLSVSGSADKTGGGTWGTFSDRRVKKDIRSFTDGLGVLMKINPVQFKYNGLAGYSDDGKDYVGIIAQEVLPVAPYMISTVRKKLNETDSEETDILKYDGSALTYVLVNSIQEQQKQIEELKGIIQDLKAKLNQYESKEQSELVSIKEQIKKLNQALGLEAKANTK